MKSEKILRGGSGGTYTDRTTCIIRQELKSRLECGSRGAAEKGGKSELLHIGSTLEGEKL